MRTIGNIERFLVLGIVVVIGAILTVAITGARDLESERSKQVAAKTGAPGSKKGEANAPKREPKTPRPPADSNGLESGRGSQLNPAIINAIDQQANAHEGKLPASGAPVTGGERNPPAPGPEVSPAPEPIDDHRVGGGALDQPAKPVTLKQNEPMTLRDPGLEPAGGQSRTNGVVATPPANDEIGAKHGSDGKEREYYYEVRKSDTLERIARALYGDGQLWKEILAANPSIADASKIKVGDKLKLPKAPTHSETAVALDAGLAPIVKPVAAQSGATAAYKRITDHDQYQVQKGDTLMSIAAANYGTKAAWHLILDANSDKVPDKDRLKTGITLKLPPN